MRALDTNILLRLILNDDTIQGALARRIVAEPFFVGTGVLLETAWVLRSSYGQPRELIAATLSALLDIPTSNFADEAGLRWAIDRYRNHGADIADMLHIVVARGSSTFASFEKHLAKKAGDASPTPIELPA